MPKWQRILWNLFCVPFMRFTMTPTIVRSGSFSAEATVIASADADTGNVTITWTNALLQIPHEVVLTLLHCASGTAGSALLSGWTLVSFSAANVIVAKENTTSNSGNANAQLRVQAVYHHSIDQ